MGPRYSLLARSPTSAKRRWAVLQLMRCRPGILVAVLDGFSVRLRKWRNLINLSCLFMLILVYQIYGDQQLNLWFYTCSTNDVSRSSKRLATSPWLPPSCSIPIALSLLALSKRGIMFWSFEEQIGKKKDCFSYFWYQQLSNGYKPDTNHLDVHDIWRENSVCDCVR